MNITALLAIIPVVLAVALIIAVVRRNITENPGGRIDITPVIPAIVVLMVALLVIGNVSDVAEDREYELYDCIPLSSFGSDATIEGDSAEIVTIGGTEYVRMTGVGTFTANGKEYTVEPARMDLVLMTGQSNSYYYSNPSFYDGPSPVAPGQVFYLGSGTPSGNVAGIATPTDVGTSQILDIVASDGSFSVAAMYPDFCGDYAKETKHRLLVVNTGIGGKPVRAWDVGEECDVYMEDAFQRVQDLVSDGSIVLNPTVALWSQGEADASNSQAYYKYHFVPLLERLWGGDYGYAFKDVLSVLPRNPSVDVVQSALAQISIAQEYSHFVIASTLPERMTSENTVDGIHYNQEAYGWLGEAFARSAAQCMRYAPVNESLVLPAEIGVVESPPYRTTVYGTSGTAYTVNATWSSDSTAGVYNGTLYGPPAGKVLVATTATALMTMGYDPSTGSLVVREDVSGSNPWDSYASSVRSLTLSEDVSSVTGTAFTGCTALEYVSIPSSLSSVQASLFGVSFKDPDGDAIAAPGPGIYAGSGDGTVYQMDESLLAYSTSGRYVNGFAAGSSAAYLVIPTVHNGIAIEGIYDAAFNGNTSLAKVVFLPDSRLTSIGTSAFSGCTSLASVDLPSTVTTLGVNSFKGSAITSMAIPFGVSSIPQACFQDCASLSSVEMPAGLLSIGYNSFNGCTSLSSVHIPAITSMARYAFYGCTGTTEVSFAEGFAPDLSEVTWAPNWTFKATDGTTTIPQTDAASFAGHTFRGTASALVMQS